jgi:hypothetical protein
MNIDTEEALLDAIKRLFRPELQLDVFRAAREDHRMQTAILELAEVLSEETVSDR